jgi:uncharacterized protein Yka (UPF0111/DUF47 family)
LGRHDRSIYSPWREKLIAIIVGIKEWVVPQDKAFFDLFDEMARTVVAAADLLVDFVENFEDVKEKCRKVKELEHQGDDISHQIYEQLNRTFITPLEPEEISRLASALDDILDYIDGTAQQMYSYGITETDNAMIELAKLIQLSVVEIEKAVVGIRSLKDPALIEERCIEVNRLENIADGVLAHAIMDLFKTKDAITIIKLKDIYENLEMATDKCEDVANVLSDIAIRHT